tara:strand:+ start:318 stop:890 length:573 start_codon:yes stop_codon:yes gene_type:complete
MFINHKHKFIFIHIPKTAGTSIRSSFDENGYDKKVVRKKYPHSTCQEVKEYCGEKVWNEYYKFTFVRNPFDRIVSFYHFHKSPQYKHPAGQERARLPLKEWIFTCKDSNVLHSQAYFVGDEKLDFVGRYENLHSDFNKVCMDIGIKPYTLPHYNKSKHDNWQHLLDKETQDYVHGIYRDDFNKFTYIYGL